MSCSEDNHGNNKTQTQLNRDCTDPHSLSPVTRLQDKQEMCPLQSIILFYLRVYDPTHRMSGFQSKLKIREKQNYCSWLDKAINRTRIRYYLGIETIIQRIKKSLTDKSQDLEEKMNVLYKCMRNFRREPKTTQENRTKTLDMNTVTEMKEANQKQQSVKIKISQ